MHAIHMLHKPVNIRYFPNIWHIERFTLHSDAIGTKQATMIIWHNQWLRIILPKEITCTYRTGLHVYIAGYTYLKERCMYDARILPCITICHSILTFPHYGTKNNVLTFVFVHIQMLVSFKSHQLADQHVITLILSKKVMLNARCAVTSLLISYHILPTYWL